MNLTKATIITWTVDALGNMDLNVERSTKLQEMHTQQKTDLSYQETGTNIWERFWVDQAAAQEYIDFMMGLDAKYGPGLISNTQIVDVNITT